ncbi:acyltransferase helD1 [Aspergillus lucknowensis]|uniref:Transferase family protein n=1 Tax=Aspergillus lucknowensis TaxID=176173 RepID=A0ABR4LHV5_9EURO
MEEYSSPVQFETYPLSAFDMQGSFSNIPYAFFYENLSTTGEPFMPWDLLTASLRASLQQFPILTGRLRSQGAGRIVIEVDATNLNLPDVRQSTCESVHFSHLKASRFAWNQWPSEVATVGPVATPAADGDIKLLNVHAVRLAENSGLVLFINIPHYAVDGVGFFAFVNHWAETMKSMQRGQTTKDSPSSSLCFDRSLITQYVPEERAPMDDVSRSIYANRALLVDWLAWLSPITLAKMLSKTVGLARGEAHLFHVSRASLDRLRDAVRPHFPAEMRLSDNDLLVALVSKTYIQSQPQPEPRSLLPFMRKPDPPTHCTVRVPCDVRPRLGVKETYTGNLLVGMLVRDRLDDLTRPTTAETLAAAALEVRKTINRVQPPLVGEYWDVLTQNPTSHMRPLAFTATRTTTSLVTTSQVRFPMYAADFGSGCPEYVCLTPVFENSYTMAAFLPPPSSRQGVDVLLTSNPVAMEGILKNEFWNSVCERVW